VCLLCVRPSCGLVESIKRKLPSATHCRWNITLTRFATLPVPKRALAATPKITALFSFSRLRNRQPSLQIQATNRRETTHHQTRSLRSTITHGHHHHTARVRHAQHSRARRKQAASTRTSPTRTPDLLGHAAVAHQCLHIFTAVHLAHSLSLRIYLHTPHLHVSGKSHCRTRNASISGRNTPPPNAHRPDDSSDVSNVTRRCAPSVRLICTSVTSDGRRPDAPACCERTRPLSCPTYDAESAHFRRACTRAHVVRQSFFFQVRPSCAPTSPRFASSAAADAHFRSVHVHCTGVAQSATYVRARLRTHDETNRAARVHSAFVCCSGSSRPGRVVALASH
jgi:hypothetical protein